MCSVTLIIKFFPKVLQLRTETFPWESETEFPFANLCNLVVLILRLVFLIQWWHYLAMFHTSCKQNCILLQESLKIQSQKVYLIKKEHWQLPSSRKWILHITSALFSFLPYTYTFLKTISTTSLVPKSLDLFPLFSVYLI